jgi:hypothetical protein
MPRAQATQITFAPVPERAPHINDIGVAQIAGTEAFA